MTRKERLERILRQKGVDRNACICPGGMMNMITRELMEKAQVYLPQAHTNAGQMADLARAVCENNCFENYGVPFCMTIEAEEMGAKVDLGSDVYEPHVIEYAISSVTQWQTLPQVSLETGRSKVVLDAIRILKQDRRGIPVIGNLTGPVSTASSVLDPVVFYREIRKKPKEAHAYMDYITTQLIRFGKAQIAAGADVLAISDPSGTGEILGPGYFEEYVVRYMNCLLDGIRDGKTGTIVHICGQMRSVFSQVDQIQSDALSFDSMVPMQQAKKHLKDRVLMGNVSTYALEFGTPDRVRTLTRSCIENGSSLLSPACGIGMKAPLENIQAILEEVNRYYGSKKETEESEDLLGGNDGTD